MSVVMAGAGTTTPSDLQLELIQRFAPQVWMGMSSYGLHLANLAEQKQIDLASRAVELLICSAEPLSSAKRQKLERTWKASVRDSFGMTEAGMMGAEDGLADGFRIWSDLFYIEVVDPDTRLPVADGEIGGLVVTALETNNVTPFLRWYSGDLVSCRRSVPGEGPFAIFPVLKHAHRTNGFFKIRGVNITHAELEDLVFRNGSVSDFKCEAVTCADRDELRIYVELTRGADADVVRSQLRDQIKSTFEITPQVLLLESGILAREFEASLKVNRMVDLRKQPA
jgi:phenylacetate-CoA ligase